MSDETLPNLETSEYRQSLWLEREQPVLDLMKGELADCGQFIDVGTNIGDYTFIANKHLKNARIICIEPNADLNPVIDDAIRKSVDEHANNNEFIIVNKVISATKGEIEFFIAENPALSNISNRTKNEDRRIIESVPLDDYFEAGRSSFIKMDIEGAEYQAVSSGKKFLASDNTKFMVELHSWGDKALRKYPINVATLFLRNGYRIRKIDPTYVFGSHYIFEKASFLPALASWLYYLPLFLAQYILYRLFESRAQSVVNYLRRFKKT